MLSVGQAARELKCHPREISDLLYQEFPADDAFPTCSGRRLIPRERLDELQQALATRRPRGKAAAENRTKEVA